MLFWTFSHQKTGAVAPAAWAGVPSKSHGSIRSKTRIPGWWLHVASIDGAQLIPVDHHLPIDGARIIPKCSEPGSFGRIWPEGSEPFAIIPASRSVTSAEKGISPRILVKNFMGELPNPRGC